MDARTGDCAKDAPSRGVNLGRGGATQRNGGRLRWGEFNNTLSKTSKVRGKGESLR